MEGVIISLLAAACMLPATTFAAPTTSQFECIAPSAYDSKALPAKINCAERCEHLFLSFQYLNSIIIIRLRSIYGLCLLSIAHSTNTLPALLTPKL